MKSYKILHAAPDHVVIDDGGGKPFKVAISNRHVKTVQKILGMADGGEVKPQDKPEEKPSLLKRIFLSKPPVANSSPSINEAKTEIENRNKRADQIAASERYADGGEVPKEEPGFFDAWQQQLKEQETRNLAEMTRANINIKDLVSRGMKPTAPQHYPNPEAAANATAPEGYPGAPPPAEEPPPAPATAPQQPTQPMAIPGAPAEFGAGARQELAGIQSRASAAAGEGGATAGVLQNLETQRQALNVGFQQRMAENQARADAMFNEVQQGKVDPNRLWHNMGTGQRIGATIGMILGGIGAGMTHGPNYALGVIDKAIDRDVDAQKLDLQKKETLLGRYMQQGHDIQTAHQMAKADLLDVASAQLQKTSAQYAGQKAAAEAQISAGALRQQAAGLRQQGEERALQIAQGKIGVQMQAYQTDALRQLLSGVGGGGGFDRRMLEMPGMDKYRERAVDLPDGSIGFAADKEEANKVRESMATVGRLKAKLGRYQNILKSGSPVTFDRGTAQAVRADLLAETGHLHDLNRLSDRDLELFERQVPDITDIVKPNAGAKLKAFGQSIDDKVWSMNRSLLSRPNARRPNG